MFEGMIEFLLSAGEQNVRVSQEAIRKLEKEDLRKARDEYDEYRHRHPETVGVKNGKAYVMPQDTEKGVCCTTMWS